MSVQQTISIIKPDAVANNLIGKIYTKFENSGLKIVAAKMMRLTQTQAENFYNIHRERPFFQDLVKFMCSGPIMIQILEGEDAVAMNRKIMGATNPQDAELGTIRKEFAISIDQNAVHGSDSLENSQTEIAFFFSPQEIYIRSK